MNQILEIGLCAYVAPSLNDWSHYLASFALAYNTSVHTSTGFSPAFLMRGFDPLKTSDLLVQTNAAIKRPAVNSDKADQFENTLIALRKQAHDALMVAQAAQQKHYNAQHLFELFEPGDQVLINLHSLQPLHDQGKGQKLLPRYEGPFEVQQ